MGREENFRHVMDHVHGDDEWAKQVDAIVHGFMDFIIQCTGATEGELTSDVRRDHVGVKDGDFVEGKQYRARVVVKGANGEEWVLQVSTTVPNGT
jgi:hypothetical protein